MRVIGFNFSKINVEKFSSSYEKLNVKTNIDILEINSVKQDIFRAREDLIGVKFKFTLKYEPEIAVMDLAGDIIFSVDTKDSSEILKQWKEKKMPDDFRIVLFNFILRKSNLKAFQLEDEMGLPLHLSLPSVRKEDLKTKE